ncbi:hypothetical protein L7F22_002212 [Adiantum nelumboides]|nr:hypothetical protein [Adiantum nelumboides]
MSDNALKTAKFMEELSSLKNLNLSRNNLTVDRLGGFPCIKELSSLRRLQELTLSENPICRQPHYRSAVISILEQLVCLDGEDVTEEQVVEAEQYANREEKASGEMWVAEQDMADAQGGKVALKVTPFNFDAMSATLLHGRSCESWDFEQTRSSGVSRNERRPRPRPRPAPAPALILTRKVKENHGP